MNQQAFTLDEVTKSKIKKSALIAFSGFLVAAVPILLPELVQYFHDKPLVAAAIGSFGTFVVASAREFVKGQ